MSATVLSTALAFARRGYAVFPVNWPVAHNGHLRCSCGSDSRGRPCGKNAAKHPYGKLAPNGLLSASTESWQIKLWWQREPQVNLGVCTDRLVVIDVDPRHDGDESFAALEREDGAMPLTWRSLTGGGGEHIIFACPDGVEIASFAAENYKDDRPLGPGIDIRARGGYIVAPPSRHISGRPYAWSVDHYPADVALAPAPDWLIERLTARTTTDGGARPAGEPLPSDVWSKLTREPVMEYRDMAATRIAGHLFCHSCDYVLVLGLLHAWNATWCKPPLDYHELKRIVDRIARREAARIERQLREDGR
jgi:hypothetical protein